MNLFSDTINLLLEPVSSYILYNRSIGELKPKEEPLSSFALSARRNYRPLSACDPTSAKKKDVLPEAADLKEVIRPKQPIKERDQVFFVYISVQKYLVLHCVQAGSWKSLVDCKSVGL